MEINSSLPANSCVGSYQLLMPQKSVVDDTTKVLILNENKEAIAVLICAYIKFGDLPKKAVLNSSEIKLKLNGEVSDVVISPLCYGEKAGVYYSLWQYYSPFSSNKAIKYIQKNKLKSQIFSWLLSASEQSKVKASEEEVREKFIKPLELLYENNSIRAEIKHEIGGQIKKIKNKKWQPFFCIEHNDFWLGNILINKKNSYGISVIDWAGANSKGFAIYDLIRISLSMKVSNAFFLNQLSLICEVLECDIENSKGYLLSSFANLAMNLGDFPEERFVCLLDASCEYLFKKI